MPATLFTRFRYAGSKISICHGDSEPCPSPCPPRVQVLTLMSGDYKVLSETIKARQAETAADLSLAADPTLTAAGEAETNTVSESGDEDSRTA